ncbi:MAG TPA: GAF and ANTAR domain-containing protein [Micromonosporaceae bacterium]|nr:GAF and ANTAR domain-containing protein [Micromonosporaceae bacterium]
MQPRPAPPSALRPEGPLVDSLVTLAGTPDETDAIDTQLVRIAQLAANLVPAVSYASITTLRDDSYTTVAASNDIARAVDEAQYADGTGPCMDAMQTAAPVAMPDVTATMAWPRFRDEAFRLGLRSSLSIPLFAGSGVPIAALNLYGHDPATMAPLIAEVWSVYDPHRTQSNGRSGDTPGNGLRDNGPREGAARGNGALDNATLDSAAQHSAAQHSAALHSAALDNGALDNGALDSAALDNGAGQLLTGLTEAFSVRALIQRAIGVMMAGEHRSPEGAYLHLRDQAEHSGRSLTDVATAVLVSQASPAPPAD